MTDYIVKAISFNDSNRPKLVLGTDTIIRFQIVDASGTPIPQNAADRYTIAVDSNFDHSDALMSFTSDVTVADAENGILEALIPCNTAEFKMKLNGLERITVWIELARYSAGNANPEILLRDTCSALNRVQYGESEPESSDVEYYTAAQVDALLAYKAIALAACSGMGEILEDNAFTMTWIDPENVMLNGATLAEWNQTVLVRKVGSYPADHTDGTVIATTSRALGNKNAYRSTGFTDSERESGTTYYYKLFSQTTAGVWNNLTGNQFVESTNMSWGMVQAFVRAGRGPELFPVGTVFEVEHPEYTHTNGQGLLFRVDGHDQVPSADESLTHTMCLELVDCLFSAPFDAAESLYALTEDTTAKAGKTYYVYSDEAYTALVDGTDYNIGDPVPPVSWYEKNIPDRSNYGNSNPVHSNMMQWLNSSGAAGQWFTKQTIWDGCSSSLVQKNGFCKYIDQEFLAVVKPAKLISTLYSEDGGQITHTARFWPLSRTQISGNGSDNVRLEYYQNGGSTASRQTISTGASVSWFTRNPVNSYYLYAQPNLYVVQASQSFGYTFACIIA